MDIHTNFACRSHFRRFNGYYLLVSGCVMRFSQSVLEKDSFLYFLTFFRLIYCTASA